MPSYHVAVTVVEVFSLTVEAPDEATARALVEWERVSVGLDPWLDETTEVETVAVLDPSITDPVLVYDPKADADLLDEYGEGGDE